MAEMIHTVSFRCGEETYQFLRGLSEREHRKLGDVVRILLEMSIQDQSYEVVAEAKAEEEPHGKV
jgi:predicted DNA-binding protein